MKDTQFNSFRISSYEVDPRGKGRLTTIANYLQETAYSHASSLQLGYTHLAEKGLAWVLSRIRINMVSLPEWDQQITVETWPQGLEKLFALRNFRIWNDTKEILGVAQTCWLMVNTDTLRPHRIDPAFIPIELRTEDHVFDRTVEKLPAIGEIRRSTKRQVKYSDLDVVGHTNNVKYMEWALDALEEGEMQVQAITDITVNYLAESKLGELVDIRIDQMEQSIMISGFNETSQKETFRCLLS